MLRATKIVKPHPKCPIAVDPDAVGEYPAFTKAGGGYFYDEVLEYRVWIHDQESGGDYYYAFPDFEDALRCAETTRGASEPIVLVRQHEYVDEPKPGMLIHMKEERVAEWCIEWLDRGPRQPGQIEKLIAENSTRVPPGDAVH